MPKFFTEDGTEVEGFTKEEVDAINAEKERLATELADREDHLKKKTEELAGLRGQNKKLSEMTEEEKKRYSAVELELKKNQEELAGILETQKGQKRESMFDRLTGNDPKIKEKAKEHYGLISLPDDTDEAMLRRAQYAVNNARADLGLLTGETIGRTFSTTGDVPTFGTQGEKKFTETERGKAAEKEIFGDIIGDNK